MKRSTVTDAFRSAPTCTTIGILRVVAGGLMATLVACGGDTGAHQAAAPPRSPAPSTTEEPVAAVLAAMDERSGQIGEYRDLLGTLRPRCQESPNRIADFVVDAQQLMADHARQETMLTVLRAIVAAVPPGRPPTGCGAVAMAVANRLAP